MSFCPRMRIGGSRYSSACFRVGRHGSRLMGLNKQRADRAGRTGGPASRRRARWRQTPRRSQVRPIGATPSFLQTQGKGPRSRAMALAALIRSRRKNPECVTFPARHSYTTHCGLLSMMALARRCADMDVHKISTALSPNHRCPNDRPNSRPIPGRSTSFGAHPRSLWASCTISQTLLPQSSKRSLNTTFRPMSARRAAAG